LSIIFFNDWAKESIKASGEIRLPFGTGKSSPISTQDLAIVIAEILSNPTHHIGKVYELTGPSSLNGNEIANEYSLALGKQIKYADVSLKDWKKELDLKNIPDHVRNHIYTMSVLHRENQYDRMTSTFEEITNKKPTSIQEWVKDNIKEFTEGVYIL